MSSTTPSDRFLQPPSGEEYQPEYRAASAYTPLHTFQLPKADTRQYQQQYGDLYFLRLAKLKPAAEKIGRDAWDGFTIAGEKARKVPRVLDVRQGDLCWVTGTVYMDLPLKPNILDDVAKDNYASAPPPRQTYIDPSNPNTTQIMLEDESGRLRMTGILLRTTHLVTGVIIAVLGTENSNGDFEVIDIKVPDFPAQPLRWEMAPTDKTEPTIKRTENTSGKASKIAFVSGLGITGSSSDSLTLELLTDYLLGYTGPGGEDDESPARISRLVIAGNSLGDVETITAAAAMDGDMAQRKKQAPKKYGYDASAYNASPITQLDNFLSELLPSIPVTLMPGESDPANSSLPQQGIHRAMLPRARMYCSDGQPGDAAVEPGWFDNVTNPWEGYVDGWRLWGCSGQNVDDVLRYLDFSDEDGNPGAENDGETSVRIMEAMLRWRCAVPTAPDTLWCYPFQTHDPFILQACPHLFFIGNQSQFKTIVVESEPPPFRLNGPDSEMANTEDEKPPTRSQRNSTNYEISVGCLSKLAPYGSAAKYGQRVRIYLRIDESCKVIIFSSSEVRLNLLLVPAVSTSAVLLVPYSKRHVLKYHEWMKDEEIQQATASEPLTLEEEYSMQQSWRQDADKLTFIACLALPSSSNTALSSGKDDAPDRMIGDTNLFLRIDDDDGDSNDKQKEVNVIGEIELMIAEKRNQGRGFGRAALLSFLWFVTRHEDDIVREFLQSAAEGTENKKIKCLSVKIGQDNGRSLALFESLGFEKVAQEPNYFGEFELRRYNLEEGEVARLADKYGVGGYIELYYNDELD
ncbi:hypothetical protein UA08_00149 [Talaromyces atroroseus]|uniref:DNA-directed DNA polymerase n=1 Tax=Talaromyces atroroseus TaxID=1441469 RepID=A0A225ARA4_TALAT|nr:hypothetical protein UA08_00149 [Talaromyces atroroseus]OKL64121.1 hypothetical protein UA08_00149 [Talaromyces atroroseus]